MDASADNSSSAASASATEETGATPIASEGEGLGKAKESPRSFLQSARRNLTPEEAQSPAGVRWLTHEVERLVIERYDLLLYHFLRVGCDTGNLNSASLIRRGG